MKTPASVPVLNILSKCCVISAVIFTESALAASTWDGGSTVNANWGSADNWSDNIAPTFGNTADLIFNQAAAARLTNSINGDRTIRSLSFSADADATIVIRPRATGGNTQAGRILTFDADAGNATLTVHADAAANISIFGQAVDAGGGGGSINLVDTLDVVHDASTSGTAPVLTIGQNNNGTIAGSETVITGSGGLNKSGVGILSLAGNNTFTGGLTVLNGRVELNNNTAAGTGPITLSGATGTTAQVQLASSLDVGNALIVADDGDIKQLRKFNATADSIYSGGISINETGASNFRVLVGTGATMTITGVISGTGAAGLNKQSPGTLTLTADNTYTGQTTVAAGILVLTNAFLADASTVSISTGATLNLTHAQTDVINKLLIAGVQQPAGIYKAVGASGEGTELASITGSGKLQVLTGPSNIFATWMAGFTFSVGADTTATGDADSDGIPNVVEHVLGSAPNLPTNGPGVIAGPTGSLTWTHTLNSTLATDVNYIYEWSTDLTEWKASGIANTTGVTASLSPSAPVGGTVTVTSSITAGSADRLYVRLRASTL